MQDTPGTRHLSFGARTCSMEWTQRIAAKAISMSMNTDVEDQLHRAVTAFANKHNLSFAEAVKVMYDSLA